jgi:hypothetical protein
MKVIVGPFALWGMQAQAGSNPGAGIETAVVHYIRRIKSGKPPGAVPAFRRDDDIEPVQDDEKGRTFYLTVAQGTEAVLKQEASRQGTSVNRLVDHSIMVFLADMERAEPDPTQN